MAQPPYPSFPTAQTGGDPFSDHSHTHTPYDAPHENPFASTTTLARGGDQYDDEDDFAEKMPLAQSGEGVYPPPYVNPTTYTVTPLVNEPL